MSKFKRFARLAAGAILATGLFASAAAPASAATDTTSSHKVVLFDTGWGG
jgi:hypothetical protein